MSLIARLRSALALPAVASGDVRRLSPYDDTNHLWSFVAPDWLGAQDHRLTRAAAMRIPAVNRSRRIVCNSVARIPLRAYVGDELAPKQPTWLDRTDGPVSPYHRMLWTVDDLLFYGWSAWAVSRGADGAVIAADRIPFDQWHVEPETNKIMWTSPGGTALIALRLAMTITGIVISASVSPPTSGLAWQMPNQLMNTASASRPKMIDGTAARLLIDTSMRSVQRFFGAYSSR